MHRLPRLLELRARRLDRRNTLVPVEEHRSPVADLHQAAAEGNRHRHAERARDDRGVRRRGPLRERDGDNPALAEVELGDLGRPELAGDENRVAVLNGGRWQPLRDAGGAAAQLAHVGRARGEERVGKRGEQARVLLGRSPQRIGRRQAGGERADACGEDRILGHQAVRLQDLRLVGEPGAAELAGGGTELGSGHGERRECGGDVRRGDARRSLAHHERLANGDSG